ncbi:MAG: hypothetical protein QXE31_01005 [Candidatus Woesearchaeota archaeon]
MEKLLDRDLIPYYNQDISAKSSAFLLYSIIKNNPKNSVVQDLIITSNILKEKEPNNIVLKNTLDFFLTNLHPTDIEKIAKEKYEKILTHLEFSKNEITKNLHKKIKNNSTIFIHSINNLVYDSILSISKEKKLNINLLSSKPFGELAAEKFRSQGIKVNLFNDLEIKEAIKNIDLSLFGSEGIIKNKSLTKKGSEAIAHYINKNRIPLYVITHSLKYTDKEHKIINYEIIEPENITAYICEYGILKPEHLEKEIKFHNSKLFH